MYTTLNKIIPTLPGVYLFKDAQGTIVYIGKAKSLQHRVHSYFQAHNRDWKVEAIRTAYADLDFIITKNETEAMLLEAELIQRYQPELNTVFKTGQPFIYIMFTNNKKLSAMTIVRNKNRKGTYFGPFVQKQQARRVHHFLLQTFQLNACNKKIENGCLDYHIGNCPGTCKTDFDKHEYLFRLELAKDVLRHQDKDFIAKIKQKISEYNKQMAFEKSKRLHEYLDNFVLIFETIKTKYAPEKFTADIMVATTPIIKDPLPATVGNQLAELLGTPTPIATIDCFDISHFQSHSIVGSCIRFTNGKPDKNKFRRFKIRTLTQQNYYAALQEIVMRRYKDTSELPDLMLIDGGKGQLSAVQALFPQVHIVSLAKKEERLFGTHCKEGIQLNVKTDSGRLLIALRDYAHHFAISYHRLRQKKEMPKLEENNYE